MTPDMFNNFYKWVDNPPPTDQWVSASNDGQSWTCVKSCKRGCCCTDLIGLTHTTYTVWRDCTEEELKVLSLGLDVENKHCIDAWDYLEED